MKPFTTEQIYLCKKFSELIEQKTGVRAEPEAGDLWYVRYTDEGGSRDIPVFITGSYDGDDYAVIENGNYIDKIDKLLHPLYLEGELLEMIREKILADLTNNEYPGNYIEYREKIMLALLSDNLLTALLKLAIEVCK